MRNIYLGAQSLAKVVLYFACFSGSAVAAEAASCDARTQQTLTELCAELQSQARMHHDQATKAELTVDHLRSDEGAHKVESMSSHVAQIHDLQQQIAALFAACKVKKCPVAKP